MVPDPFNSNKTRLLAVALSLALGTVVSTAFADPLTSSAKDSDALDEIVVQAQRSTAEMARTAQKQAPNLINLTTAKEISKLPDVNTGEAIRRVPGISLETDTGEGRYVNIRGLDADLNSTTFGGLRLPPTNTSSPSGSGRAVAFDSIPVGFVGAITVTKSNLPEQDAEALGGTIDITPKTAPPDGKPFADLKLGTGYEDLRGSWIADIALTAGMRFGGHGGYDPFSILFTASGYSDRRGDDDAEAGFIDGQPAIADKAIAGFEQRYYNYHRIRHGYGLDLGYAPDAANRYFVRYYDAGYSETVLRNRLSWNFVGAPSVDPANPNGFVDQIDSFEKTLRDEKEYLDSKVLEAGGRNKLGANTLDYHVGYTRGTYYKPYDYNSTFSSSAATTAKYDNTTNPNWPVFSVVSPTNFNPADPASYTLDKINTSSQHSDDHEWGIGTNLTVPTHFTDRTDEQLKFGVNARLRNKTGDAQQFSISASTLLPLSDAVSGGNVTFYDGHYQNGPQINPDVLRSYYAANIGNAVSDPVATALNDVRDKEDVYAAYGQYQFGYGALGIVAGVRVEHTAATYAGNKADDSGSPESAACPILDPVNSPSTHVCPVSSDKSYTNVFPTAQVRYEFKPDLIGRLAISSTIARPGFQQVTASTTVDSNLNIVTGNPDLKPTTATGFDADIEKYLPYAGILSFGVFAKDIKDYIVNNVTTLDYQNAGGTLGLAKLISYANSPSAHLVGVEVNYVQRFRDQLPGALGGLGVAVNWTWVQSKYHIRPGEESVLPSTSRNTANAELMYEQGAVNMTLGAYYTSRNIFGVSGSTALDIWTQERLYLDFGSQYQLSKPLSLYINAKNLTNTALKLTEGPSDDRVIQREFYGITYQAGMTYKF